MHEAMLYDRLDQKRVHCRLCSHSCRIDAGGRGVCQVRENQDGTLMSLVWGRPIAAGPDPIEKKPLFHYLPGSKSFSVATMGCNFQCGFCQNWDISQFGRDGRAGRPEGGRAGRLVAPAALVAEAQNTACRSLSYTYTEPTVYFEYAYDTMQLAHQAGLRNVFVSNGFMSADCLAACQGLLDAANIDLKSFRDHFYRAECKGRLQPVLDSLKALFRMGVWLEVTTLLIPGKNDDPGELAELAGFIVGELAPWVPWHVSAYTPRYHYQASGPAPTRAEHLEKALEIGHAAGLEFVYAGNLPGHASESTACPDCGRQFLARHGFSVVGPPPADGRCQGCGRQLPGIWA